MLLTLRDTVQADPRFILRVVTASTWRKDNWLVRASFFFDLGLYLGLLVLQAKTQAYKLDSLRWLVPAKIRSGKSYDGTPYLDVLSLFTWVWLHHFSEKNFWNSHRLSVEGSEYLCVEWCSGKHLDLDEAYLHQSWVSPPCIRSESARTDTLDH